MARQNSALYSLNGGAVSRLALSRLDLSQLTICGEIVENWIISTMGWIGLRPGTEDKGNIRANLKPQYLRYVGNASACSLLELTSNIMRIWNDGALVSRVAVSSAFTNGDFGSLSGWASVVPTGGSVSTSGGLALIKGNGLDHARLYQAVTVPGGDAGKEHGVRIVVRFGPVQFQVGTAAGKDDVVAATQLNAGVHSLAITLSGTNYFEFSSTNLAPRAVDSIAFEGAGVVEVPTPWDAPRIGRVRYSQQGNVIFCASRNAQQRIESRSRRSWSVVEYFAANGPFRPQPANPISLTPSAKTGEGMLTASESFFRAGHVGAIFELTQSGQNITATLTAADQYTDPIRVTGVGAERKFTVTIAGTWDDTLALQRAYGTPEIWFDVKTYTANTTDTVDDGFDNSIVFYRVGFKPGYYSSGSADVTISFPGGSTVGVVRLSGILSEMSASYEVLQSLGSTTQTSMWREGSWSTYRGFPRDVAFQDGRLWWLDANLIYGSVSDDYANFDDTTDGASAPVVRSIATGPADGQLWLLKLFRLITASAANVTAIRSSSLDEAVTQTAFAARDIDQIGAADVAASAIANRGIFVGRSNIDLYEILSSTEPGDYALSYLSRLNPDITAPGIVKIAIQRRPEPRIWCVLADGHVALLTYNRDEKVVAWDKWSTDGFVEECEVLPNANEDDVYLCVNRLLNGVWTRKMEKCSYEGDTIGGITNRIADCGRATSMIEGAITGLSDFNGKTIAVWTEGRMGYRAVVSGGAVDLGDIPGTVNVWVGLAYDARFKSTKLAYAGTLGTALLQKKRVDHLGIAFDTTVRSAVRMGPDFDRMDPLPQVSRGVEIPIHMVEDDIDDPMSVFNGSWDTDSRFCVKAQAPWPCRIKAVVAAVSTTDAR